MTVNKRFPVRQSVSQSVNELSPHLPPLHPANSLTSPRIYERGGEGEATSTCTQPSFSPAHSLGYGNNTELFV